MATNHSPLTNGDAGMEDNDDEERRLIPKCLTWLNQGRNDYNHTPARPTHKGARKQTPAEIRREKAQDRQQFYFNDYFARREANARQAEKLNKPAEVIAEMRKDAEEERRELTPPFSVGILKMRTDNPRHPDEKTPTYDLNAYHARRASITYNNRRERNRVKQFKPYGKPTPKMDKRTRYARRAFNALIRVMGRRTTSDTPTTSQPEHIPPTAEKKK